MPVLTIRPDSTVTPLNNGSITGAATIQAALSDSSDSSFITVGSVPSGGGSCQVGMSSPALPAGAVVTRVTNWFRGGSAGGTSVQIQRAGAYPAATLLPLPGGLVNYSNPNTNDQYGNISQGQAAYDAYEMIIASFFSAAFIYEVWADITYTGAPTVTVRAPTGTIATTSPTVGWTHTPGTDAQTGQTYFRLKVFNAATYSAAGFNPDTSTPTSDTGAVAGANSARVIGALPPQTTYRAYVQTAQTTSGIIQWSAWAYSQFDIAVTAPGVSSVVATANDPTGAINGVATWDSATPIWETYDVEATYDGGSRWFPVRGYTNRAVPPPPYSVVLTEPFDSLAAWTLGSGGTITAGGKVGNFLRFVGTASSRGYQLPVANRAAYVDLSFWWRSNLVGTQKLATLASGPVLATDSEIQITQDSSGKLAVTCGATVWTSTAIVAANTWYRVRLVAHLASSGAVRLDLDGTTVLDVSGVLTVNRAAAIQGVYVHGVGAGVNCDFDELSLSTAIAPVTFTDFESPNDISTQYRVRASNVQVGVLVTGNWTLSNIVQWTNTGNDTWIKDPAHPERNMKVCLSALPETVYNRTVGVFRPIGARFPVTVSDVLQAATASVGVLTQSRAEETALLALLGAPVLLVQSPNTAWGFGSRYVATGTITEGRTSATSKTANRLFGIELTEVDRPA